MVAEPAGGLALLAEEEDILPERVVAHWVAVPTETPGKHKIYGSAN
jgi:hypothetical protein